MVTVLIGKKIQPDKNGQRKKTTRDFLRVPEFSTRNFQIPLAFREYFPLISRPVYVPGATEIGRGKIRLLFKKNEIKEVFNLNDLCKQPVTYTAISP